MAHILEYAPETVIIQILLNIPHEDLKSFCAINKRIRKVCGSKLVKEEYYKRNIFRAKSLAEVEEFLKKNPIGLLHITKDSDLTTMSYNELTELGDKIIYLELNNSALYRKVNQNHRFKNLKALKLYHKDGQLRTEKNYKDGILDGLSRGLYDNGKIYKELNYKDGKRDGLSRMWHPNGKLGQEQNYKNGERDGVIRSWTVNGYGKVVIEKSEVLV
jgi:antitoxin component YwqK of YwqJK toxin-antitoxin module